MHFNDPWKMYRGDKKEKGGMVAGSRSRQEVFVSHYGRRMYEFRSKMDKV